MRTALLVVIAVAGCTRPPEPSEEDALTPKLAALTDPAEAAVAATEVARRSMKHADLVLVREDNGEGRLLLERPGEAPRAIPCDRLVGAWGLWIDDVDGDGKAEAIVALRKPARFDPKVENRLHVYGFEQGECVPAWRGTRLAGRFDAIARSVHRGEIVARERVSEARRRVVRYRWQDFGYRLEEVLWEGRGEAPAELLGQFAFTEQPS